MRKWIIAILSLSMMLSAGCQSTIAESEALELATDNNVIENTDNEGSYNNTCSTDEST